VLPSLKKAIKLLAQQCILVGNSCSSAMGHHHQVKVEYLFLCTMDFQLGFLLQKTGKLSHEIFSQACKTSLGPPCDVKLPQIFPKPQVLSF